MKVSPNVAECEAVGISVDDVAFLMRRLTAIGRRAKELGIVVFGGSGTCTLRADDGNGGHLILGSIDEGVGVFDGGDGAYREDEMGLLRSEYHD